MLPIVLVLVLVVGTERSWRATPTCSSLFNTAEGNGKRQMKTRAKFFDDARGSATECAACLDALVAKRACEAPRVEQGKALPVRVVAMLSKRVDRFPPTPQVREAPAPYAIEDEDEDEDETRAQGHENEGDMQFRSISEDETTIH